MKELQQPPIKSALREMNVGDQITFPKRRKKVVRTTASELKDLEGIVFKTWMEGSVLIVKRISK